MTSSSAADFSGSGPADPEAPVVSVVDLTVDFAGRGIPIRAVNGLSFDLAPGRKLAIVGESGSGKSTAVLALLGLHRDTGTTVTGRVTVCDTDLGAASEQQVRSLRGNRIAMIFQDPLSALDPYYAVGTQIAEVYRTHTGAGRRAARARAVEVLDQVHMPQPNRTVGAYPHELSGGMRQRALIAMALACRPRVLVADEPTTALDVTVQAQVLDLIDDLCVEAGMALILVTHNLALAAGNVDDVLVMHQGRCVEYGSTSDLLTAPRHPRAKELLAAVPRLDSVVSRTRSADGAASPPQPLLRLVGVRKEFPMRGALGTERGAVRAVDGVSLDVRSGEAIGIVGESGSGKTTLARMMVCLQSPSAGQVLFDGEDISTIPDKRRRSLRRDLQMVFQDPASSLNPRRTVGASIAAPLRTADWADGRPIRRTVEQLLELVGLEPGWYDRYPHELSVGQRQRVAIARAIAPRPRLLVCDEPVSALDVSTQARVVELLADLRREFGLTLVFIAHDLAVVRQVSDRIAVMNRGAIVECGDANQICGSPRHPHTKALLAAVPVLDLELARRKRDERRRATGATCTG